MTTPQDPAPVQWNPQQEPGAMPSLAKERAPKHEGGHGHGNDGHGWMMIVCCIPMIAVAVVLVAMGVAGVGFLFAAAMCTVMMAVMMRGMGGGNRG